MRFQVILPTYNASRWFEAALASVAGHPDGEVMVIDDGSDDGERQKVEEISKRYSGVRFFPQEHRGLVGTLNYGLSVASAPYVARMDADDISLPGRFDRQLAYLDQNPDIVVVGGNILSLSESNVLTGKTSKIETSPVKIAELLVNGKNPIMHPTVMMRREPVVAIGGYRPATEYSEDYDLWLRLSELHSLANLNEALLQYRRHKSQITRSKLFRKMFARDVATISARRRRAKLHDPVKTGGVASDWNSSIDMDDAEISSLMRVYDALSGRANALQIDASLMTEALAAIRSNLMGQSSRPQARAAARVTRLALRATELGIARAAFVLGIKLNPVIYLRALFLNK